MKTTTRLLCALSVLTATTLTLVACPPPGDGQSELVFDRKGLLTGVVDNWLTPKLAAFSSAATTLLTATSAHAATPTDPATLLAAQDAWKAAMAAWQAIEPMQLGPLAPAGTRVGSEGLRDNVYVWPVASACGVDQHIVKNEFEGAGWAQGQLVSVTGLTAIETALFSADDQRHCPSSSPTTPALDALGATTVHARRASLAKVLAADLVTKVAAIQTKMDTYGAELKQAGDGSALFASAQAGVDDVYAALFYIELKVKDRKLGAPAGLTIDCPATSCPELLESPSSSTSKDHVLVNLQSVREIFLGAGGAPGFDDFLGAADAVELSTEIVDEIDAAIAAVQSYDGTFEATVLANPEQVAALYELVKAFADDFKADLASTLAVRIPAEGAGDND